MSWHSLYLSHRYLQGETLIFADGKLLGKASEQIVPRQFILGGLDGGKYKDPPGIPFRLESG